MTQGGIYLVSEQRDWLQRRNNCGGDAYCIEEWSDRRIWELEMRSRDVFR